MRSEYRCCRPTECVELTEARKKEQEALEWVRRLTSESRVLTCVYCGHEYPPGSPSHGAEVLTEHIKSCEKHPMRTVLASYAATRDVLSLLWRYCNEHLGDWYYHADKRAIAMRVDDVLNSTDAGSALLAQLKLAEHEVGALRGRLQRAFDLQARPMIIHGVQDCSLENNIHDVEAAKLDAALASCAAKEAALMWLERNYRATLTGKSVRDADECLASVRAALSTDAGSALLARLERAETYRPTPDAYEAVCRARDKWQLEAQRQRDLVHGMDARLTRYRETILYTAARVETQIARVRAETRHDALAETLGLIVSDAREALDEDASGPSPAEVSEGWRRKLDEEGKP